MGRQTKPFPPAVRTHRGADRVWWNGRWHHLGPTGSAEASACLARLLALWAVDPGAVPLDPEEWLVSSLCREYRESLGQKTDKRTVARVRTALVLLTDLYGNMAAVAFGPRELRAWQVHLAKLPGRDGRTRYNATSVTQLVAVVKRAWRWAASWGKLPVELVNALETVEPIDGRMARPAGRRQAAKRWAVEATLPYLRPPARAMIRLMLLYGTRPGELCAMTPADVHRGGVVDVPEVGEINPRKLGVWVYLPKEHKTAYRGDPAWVAIGPAGQEILAPFLLREPGRPCFSPQEALADLRREQREGRRGGGDKKPKVKVREREYRDRYTPDTLRQAVDNAIRRANARRGEGEREIPHFSPYALRHLAAVEIDASMGLDAAQAALRHRDPEMTRRYTKGNNHLDSSCPFR